MSQLSKFFQFNTPAERYYTQSKWKFMVHFSLISVIMYRKARTQKFFFLILWVKTNKLTSTSAIEFSKQIGNKLDNSWKYYYKRIYTNRKALCNWKLKTIVCVYLCGHVCVCDELCTDFHSMSIGTYLLYIPILVAITL